MSLFGSLFTGVSALSAQSQSMAMISNNIANVNTTGFKRSEASFNALVTSESRSSLYSPGTVTVNRQQRVDLQGPVQQSSSSSDVSISGNGFFAVRRAPNSDQEMLFTRNGSFNEDSQGHMRNSAGFYLYGWPLDSEGKLPSSSGDITSLVPVDVAFLGGLTRPTTSAELVINLNSDENNYNPHLITPSSQLPVPTTTQANFQRGLRVFDSLGSAKDLTFEFRKIVGPMANATTRAFAGISESSNLVGTVFPDITAGDSFSVTVGTTSQTYVMGAAAGAGEVRVDTVDDLLKHINNTFGGGATLEARLGSDGRILFQCNDPSQTLTFANVSGTPLTDPGGFTMVTDPGADDAAPDLTYEPEAQLTAPFTTYTDQSDFPTLGNTTSPNTQGWWEMRVLSPDGLELSKGLVNFDTNGQINALPDSEGNIDIELNGIDWGNGSSPQDISIDISRFSQFSGNYNVIYADQNGAELGLRTGIEIDRDGYVSARFSNGATARLYKLPLVTFANANGLNEVSGTAYAETSDSGEENLREAGTGGAGFIEPSTIEASNVDLADEFAKMIITQRAYSAGTKVISTADEMTEELIRLR